MVPEGLVLTGDALVTGHPLSRVPGPQVLRDFFHHHVAAMLSSLDILGALAAGVVVPGHGPGLARRVVRRRPPRRRASRPDAVTTRTR